MHDDGERDFPDWVLAVASAVGLVLALPFAYFMVVEWLELVSLGGWFSYVMVAWAVGWVLFLLNHLFGDRLDPMLPWTELGQVRRARRRGDSTHHP